MGFDRALSQAGLPQPGSNRGYRPEQLIVQRMLSVWCGGNRFEHAEVTRFDRVLGSIFGIQRMANFKAITRLFDRCTQAVNDRVFITHEGRRLLLKLATAMQKREWISGLWDQSKQYDLPVHFETQFTHPDTS